MSSRTNNNNQPTPQQLHPDIEDDLRSPSSSCNNNDDDDGDINNNKAHSFRERRLTYTRHHVLSDNAAAAVAELLADGSSDLDLCDDDNDNDRTGSNNEGRDVDGQTAAADKVGDETKERSSAVLTTKRELDDDKKKQQSPPHKRSRNDSVTSSSSSFQQNHLPSRILHAGEIVRRLSDSEDNTKNGHDVRTGMYSHPTHPNHHHNHHHGYHHAALPHHSSNHHLHKSKWRQRFSFCSTAPDHILPFPRNIVGTYSCHGMEPVYGSDYEDDDFDNSSSSSDDEDDNSKNNPGGEEEEKKKTSSTTTTTAKINQDRGGITYPYANSNKMALFAVYDGHGEGGELVSQYALGEVQRLLEEKLSALSSSSSSDSRKKKKKKESLDGIAEEGERNIRDEQESGEDVSKQQQQEEEEQQQEEEETIITQSFKEVFTTVDRGLLNESDIEPMYSGTTACVVLLKGNKLYISNCGDSRAVLAQRRRSTDETTANGSKGEVTYKSNKLLTTIDLSKDQNPDSPGEKERIISSGGFVSPPPEPGLSSRVWLDSSHTQIGLAMARSIGDHAVKGVGVIAEPVVTTHTISEYDEYMILATDGVWEFITSEYAVDIVGKHLYNGTTDDSGGVGGSSGASSACEALIKAASEKWHEHEGDYRDDITAIVIRLKDLWK